MSHRATITPALRDAAAQALRAGGAPALEGALMAITAICELRWSALWCPGPSHAPLRLAACGATPGAGAGRQLASRLLRDGDRQALAAGCVAGVALEYGGAAAAAVLARGDAGAVKRCKLVLAQARPLLCAALARDIAAGERALGERALLGAAERRLLRLGYDLHDGPVQDVVALAQELRLLTGQLAALKAADREHLLRGRLEDLEAHLRGLDGGLRQISAEARLGERAAGRPLRPALEDALRRFAQRGGARAQMRCSGSLAGMSDSQRIALLNIVSEALSNVHRHASARNVRVLVSGGRDAIRLVVHDDGCGFDPEAAARRGSPGGSTGLVAMRERARLLGGDCTVDSRPGGPTALRVLLPRFAPAARRRRRAGSAAQAAASERERNGARPFSTA